MEDNKTNTVDTQTTETQVEKQVEEKAEVKTFTQDDVNKIIKERLEKAKKGLPSEEELNSFKSWQESQKTEAEKIAEKEKEYLEKEKTFSNIEKENKALKNGVDAKEMDYVLFKVSKMEGNFDENLKEFLKVNPKYSTNSQDDEDRVIKVGKEKNGEVSTPSNEKFEEMARRMGLDPKDL